MLFVMLAGVELDLKKAWQCRRESATTAALLLMAAGSTMLTIPVVHPKLNRAHNRALVNASS
jgi:Kef-type K+ transport system membrane component KefB